MKINWKLIKKRLVCEEWLEVLRILRYINFVIFLNFWNIAGNDSGSARGKILFSAFLVIVVKLIIKLQILTGACLMER